MRSPLLPHPLSSMRFHGSLFVVLLAGSASASASAQWPQWGGPDRDFRSPATGLAETWPEAGPKRIWERALGAGYSSIVADGGRLFTLYRSGEEEVVVALDAETGTTVWEHKQRTTSSEPPNSTPIIAGDRLYALGFSGMLYALDKNSGKLAWSHDLVKEYGAKRPDYGFAASPLVHGGSLILPIGGAGYGVGAFSLADGKLLWHAHDLEEVYASPLLIQVEGEAQVAVLATGKLVGLSPETGELLWSEPIEGEQNIATPVWCSDNLLCVTAGTGGCLGFRFSKADGKTKIERAWKNELQIPQTTVVRAGDYLYGSTGHDPFFVTAMHAKTGEVAWREPGFSLANLVAADGKILLLDVEGVLALGTAGPEAWKVNSKVNLLKPQAFTAPTVDGKSLYLRDLERVIAIDLGKPN
ncbi:MAG TPA: PQQ-binding-like beta-propeller repeat protein [Thermoanaerobaculia bacterium]